MLDRQRALEILRKIAPCDCVQLMRAYEKETGHRLDHHEFAYFLDAARERGIVKIVRWGGFQVYDLERTKE